MVRKGCAVAGRGGQNSAYGLLRFFMNQLLRVAAAWTDGFLNLNGTPYDGSHGPHPSVKGRMLVGTRPQPGVAQPGDATHGTFTDPRLGGGNAGSPIWPVPAGAVTVGPPASPVRPVSTNGLAPLVPTSSAVGGGLDQALVAIASYNPLSQRLTFNSQTGEWLFEVKVPMPGTAAQIRAVEGTAPTPEAAVRLVLDQLSRGP